MRTDVVLERRAPQLALAMGAVRRGGAGRAALRRRHRPPAGRVTVGSLWVTLLLATLLAVARVFNAERDEGLLDALVLAPIPRTAIWAAKAIGIGALLVLMEAVAVPLSYLFLPADAPVPHVGTLLLALVAGNVGLAALGSLVAAVASAVRGREVMVPLLFLPAAVPLLIAALACSVHASVGRERRAPSGPGTALRCHRRPARIRRMRARPDRLTPVGTHDRLLRPAVLAAGSLLVLSTLLIALWVPSDRAEGYRQRIFYLHVPIALTAYLFLLIGAFYAARYLMRRDPMDDLRSYVAIHQGVILGTLVLISGPIWAKVSWGIWWDWSDKQLNTFLLVFLFYCAYFMLRYSVDEGARRERFSAIYALLGIGMVPLSLAAVHLAGTLHHPTVFHRDGPAMENSMFIAFLVSWAAFILLAFVFWRLELRGKLLAQGVQRLERRLRGETVLP